MKDLTTSNITCKFFGDESERQRQLDSPHPSLSAPPSKSSVLRALFRFKSLRLFTISNIVNLHYGQMACASGWAEYKGKLWLSNSAKLLRRMADVC